MATSGNHQVILSSFEESATPGAGGPLEEAVLQLPVVPAGAPTPQDSADSLGPVPSGSQDLLQAAEVGGPIGGGSVVEGDGADTLGPLPGGSTVPQDEADAMAGNIQGRPNSGLAHTAPGGLGVSVDGAATSEREEVNLLSANGLSWDVDDNAVDERADVSPIVEAEIELAKATVDLVAGGNPVLIPAVSAPLVGLEITRISVRTLTVTTPGTAPQVSLVASVGGNVVSTTVVTPTAANRLQSILADVESPFVGVGETVSLVKDVLSTAVAYSVEVAVYGRQRR